MQGKKLTLRRRTFLGAGLAVAAGGAAFFTAEEGRTVDAICERLIPADRYPGAREVGVVNYIDIQLTKAFKKHQRIYRQGIAEVDAASRKTFGNRFADLSPEQQGEALKDVEKNSKAFFELILTHTRQGFCGDPRTAAIATWRAGRCSACRSSGARAAAWWPRSSSADCHPKGVPKKKLSGGSAPG